MRLMPYSCLSLRAWTLPLAAALLGLSFTARAAQSPPPAAGKAKATTNVPPAELEPPKSVFIIPASSEEGKDPFFPLSTRLRPSLPVVTPTTPNVAPAVVQLDLKGISGAVDRRLAIINNRTFAVGEEGELSVNAGRVRVVCKEIKDDSVVVLVNGQERILRLRPGS
jgi:hypothetical protein